MNYSIEGLKRKDRGAWRDLYECTVQAVYAHALYRVAGDREGAEDVTQEVFVRAIEFIGNFEGDEEAVPVWLKGIVNRIVARQLRRLNPVAARTISLDAPREDGGSIDVADDLPGPEARLLMDEECLRTNAVLSSLLPQWQQVLRLKYYDGRSVVEIASRLDTTPKAVESLLSRARQAFREAYERVDHE